VRLLMDSPPVKPGYPADGLLTKNYPGLEWLEVGNLRIPLDRGANALVPYRGPEHSFQYVSATDVLHDRVPAEDLKDKIALIGTTAPGLQDLRSTPAGPLYPGVEIHANLIGGMLDGTIKQKPPYVLGAEVFLLLLTGVIMAVVLPFLNPLKATLVTVGVLAAVVAGNLLIWNSGNLVLPLASGLLMVVMLYALNMSYGYFVETRVKRQITSRFGQYVPPEIAEEMSRDPERFSMEGESRELTVLFSDVRDFTSLSEGLDPKALSRLMNAYLTPMTEVIYGHRGTIDKYMGDAIMAFWGAPLADKDHARNAVLAGLEMQITLKSLDAEFRANGWRPLSIGIGLNTGRMSVGNMGSAVRVAYTVMGDAVNLASRLESLTKKYGVTMIIGEETRKAVPDVVVRELDRVRVKGKDEPVAIFEPIGLQGSVDKETLDRLSRAGLGQGRTAAPQPAEGGARVRAVQGVHQTDRPLPQRSAAARLGRRLRLRHEIAMLIRVLGCSGGIGGNLRTTSMLLDQDVLIDAGTGVGDLTLSELQLIDHVFLTHSHLDHLAMLPFLVDTVGGMRSQPITVHATACRSSATTSSTGRSGRTSPPSPTQTSRSCASRRSRPGRPWTSTVARSRRSR
jgi:class 3 adenylate cyclase